VRQALAQFGATWRVTRRENALFPTVIPRPFRGAHDPKGGEATPSAKENDQSTEISAIELMRIAPLDEAAKLSSVSEKTLRRHFSSFIIRISPRRHGMRVRDALMLGRHAAN
jgi:hypothetical protein